MAYLVLHHRQSSHVKLCHFGVKQRRVAKFGVGFKVRKRLFDSLQHLEWRARKRLVEQMLGEVCVWWGGG